MTATSPGVQQISQHLETDDLVVLYTIDVTPLGVPQMWHFTNGKQVKFRGFTFVAADVKSDGFEWNGQGAMPQPTISVSNATRMLSGIVGTYKDLVGAKLIRIKTYARYLDEAPGANPDEAFAADIYNFEQKTAHDKYQLEWTLSAAMDQQGKKIPGRRVLRDVCMWRYRRWTGATFDYSKVQCPYNGVQSYTKDKVPTTPANDRCGRHVSDCELRFGANAELPFGGFPGVTRVRL
ncbi:minor tail protein [Rhizobium phage vB_RleS_L338C]|uniref:minor tail protein n=1 Tax=Rhizobium phage vB_RleS_L338C TaxID=1414737 RepID=UPI0003D9004B|nr:minor tail protein [Rhizobium phage vB_RleS_L338C]AHC30454.1 minor tail protein [Rhizobium phage vB_RleS_L338C]QNH72067.1 minor tail protein [Rhizobium phage P11VFA]